MPFPISKKREAWLAVLCIGFFLLLISGRGARADEYSSTNFSVSNPVLAPGGYSTSLNFGLHGVLSQMAIGTSSATTFKLNGGFLFFPAATSPVVSATTGNAQVSLSWTASLGFLGYNISGYQVGQSTVSGGGYGYTAVGNVTSSVQSGLTNGTPYYFIVRALDFFGDVVATSSEVTSTPTGGGSGGTGGGGSGGGGGGGYSGSGGATKIMLKGLAYPGAKVVILKDASFGQQVIGDVNGDFEATFPLTGASIYSFSIYALDADGHKSVTFSFSVNAIADQTVTTSDIIVSPTIGADKSVVKLGNTIQFFGYAYPLSSVSVMINSNQTILDKIKSDKFGRWIYPFESEALEMGQHTTRTQTLASAMLVSPFSQSFPFEIGDKDVLIGDLTNKPSVCDSKGDINKDGKVNIVDFSIMLYFFGQHNPKNPCVDLNHDNLVNLADFSILLYWWTG